MFSTDDALNVSLSLPQLRQLVALAEGAAIEGEDELHTRVTVFPVSGLRALEKAVIVKVSAYARGGHNGYDEALIDKNGQIRVGYEPDKPQGGITVQAPQE